MSGEDEIQISYPARCSLRSARIEIISLKKGKYITTSTDVRHPSVQNWTSQNISGSNSTALVISRTIRPQVDFNTVIAGFNISGFSNTRTYVRSET